MQNNQPISEVFAPRWSKNDVLVSTDKVFTDGSVNYIKFTKIVPDHITKYSKHYTKDDVDFFVNNLFSFTMDGEDYFPIENNNGRPCYAIPLSVLTPCAIGDITPYNIIIITKEQYEHFLKNEAKLERIEKLLQI